MSLSDSFPGSEHEPTPDEEQPKAIAPSDISENNVGIKFTKESLKFLKGIEVGLLKHVTVFERNDMRVNGFVMNVLGAEQKMDDQDKKGKFLDDYLTKAAESISEIVVLMIESGEPDEEIHGLVKMLLVKSDSYRIRLLNGLVDQTKMTIEPEDEDELSGQIAGNITMTDAEGSRSPHLVASKVAETYFAMTAAKLAAVREYVDAGEHQEQWAKLVRIVEDIRDQNKKEPETLQQRLGRQALDVVKIVAGTTFGVIAGLAADRWLRRHK